MADDSIREEIASLTDRIRREGQLDRNGKNSLKAVIDGNVIISDKIDVTNNLLTSIQSMLSDALGDMARAMRTGGGFTPAGGGADDVPDTQQESVDPGTPAGLGLVPLGIAGLLGAVAGMIAGQITAIKAFAKALTPTSIVNALTRNLRGMRLAIAMNIDLLTQSITERFTSIRTAFTNALANVTKSIRGLFSGVSGNSQLSKVITTVFTRVKNVTDLFVDAFKLVGGYISGVVGRVVDGVKTGASLASKFSLFANAFKAVSKIVGKIFAPIAIIITLYDTIKGTIDGFLSDGLTGAFEGAMTGFFNSLIFGPLDLVKDAIAWVLGFFGFDNASQALRQFSFADTFSQLVGAIFEPLHGIKDLIVGIFTLDGTKALDGIGRIFDGFFGIITAPLDAVIGLVRGAFSLAGFELPEFSIKDFISGVVDNAIGFVKGIFGFGGDGGDDLEAQVEQQERLVRNTRNADAVAVGDDGSVNLANRTVNGLNDVRGAEINLEKRGLEVLGRDERDALVAEQEAELERRRAALTEFQNRPNIMQIVSDGAAAALDWLKGLFSFDSAGDVIKSAINLAFLPTNIAIKVFGSIGSWFAGLLGFDETSDALKEASEWSIGDLVGMAFDKIKELFANMLDFLPSFDDIKASLTSMLPSWMRPENVAEQRASIEEEIANQQAEIAGGDERNWRGKSREAIIAELQEELASLPQMNVGGIIDAGEGSPVMLHGQEAVIPLDNPKAQSYLTGMAAVNSAASASARPSNNNLVSNSGNNVDNSSRQTTTTYVSPSRPRVGPDPAAV